MKQEDYPDRAQESGVKLYKKGIRSFPGCERKTFTPTETLKDVQKC